jgi:hypothetical protein
MYRQRIFHGNCSRGQCKLWCRGHKQRVVELEIISALKVTKAGRKAALGAERFPQLLKRLECVNTDTQMFLDGKDAVQKVGVVCHHADHPNPKEGVRMHPLEGGAGALQDAGNSVSHAFELVPEDETEGEKVENALQGPSTLHDDSIQCASQVNESNECLLVGQAWYIHTFFLVHTLAKCWFCLRANVQQIASLCESDGQRLLRVE